MILCVDGTGPSNIEEYDKAMQPGFIKQIYSHTNQKYKEPYYRGPDWKGIGSRMVNPRQIVQIVREYYQKGDQQVFLAGYSRGGAVVIRAARYLRDDGIPVEAMFLFDAVDRIPDLISSDFIPSNVRVAYHAMRHKQTNSRESFGNCGTKEERAGTLYPPAYFRTTHGGMGGTPWGKAGLRPAPLGAVIPPMFPTPRIIVEPPATIYEGVPELVATNLTPEQEAKGMTEVRTWMWGKLRQHKVIS